MDWQALDEAIDELEGLIPRVSGFEWIRIKETWGRVWEQCKVIQEGFRSVRYPTVNDRHAAWNRFQDLRRLASDNRRHEDEAYESRSKPHRDEILEPLDFILRDETRIFQFSATSRKELEDWNETLRTTREKFNETRRYMTRDHSIECREAIDHAQVVVNNWWETYKALSRERYEAKQQDQQAWLERKKDREDRRADRRVRIQANIDSNREQRERAIGALRHQQERRRELLEKLAETTSEKWSDIVSGWLSECDDKISSIEGRIDTLEGWISEGEAQLAAF